MIDLDAVPDVHPGQLASATPVASPSLAAVAEATRELEPPPSNVSRLGHIPPREEMADAAESLQALLMPGGFPASDSMPLEKASAPNRIRKSRNKRKAALSPDPEDVSFVRQARRQEFWRRPWMRAFLWLMLLSLSALLAAQVALQQRNRLVAAYPALRPWVEQACQPLGCDVQEMQQIESVLIDSSAMVRLGEGAFRFEVVLKNTSELMLAVPALELTLTNASEEAVVRRVILPSEWSAPPDELPALSELPLSVRMTLVDAAELRMAGYRAVVFYP